METKVLIIAVVEKDGKILMRKKPDGSPPYDETWYIFGAPLDPSGSVENAITHEVKVRAGINITVREKISWDTEIKDDVDGIKKHFVYLDVLCDYSSGELVAGEGVERLEWVSKAELASYDIVPPSRILFQKLRYV